MISPGDIEKSNAALSLLRSIFSLVVICTVIVPAAGASVTIHSGPISWSIDPGNLQISASKQEDATRTVVLKNEQSNSQPVTVEMDRPADARWNWPDKQLSFRCSSTTAPGGLAITIKSIIPQTFSWPRINLPEQSELLWPLGEGLRFNVSDDFYRKEIIGREWETGESLSMPLFGKLDDDCILSWFTCEPHRTILRFETTTASTILHSDFDFSDKAPSMEVTYIFHLDEPKDVLAPARHYRDYLTASGQFKSLGEKSGENSDVELLKGAAHVYLWGDRAVSPLDIPRNKWQSFCQKLVNEAGKQWAATWIKSSFTDEEWKAVEDGAKTEWPYDYLKRQIASGLSELISHDDNLRKIPNTMAPEEIQTLLQNEQVISAEQKCSILANAFPGYFLPVDQWGDGASLKMLDAFSTAGLDRLKLCTPDQAALAAHPWVVDVARKRGWLIGTYDSYHSVHSPDENPENTWSTAQMNRGIYTSGSVIKKDGTYYKGFRGIGRKVNSLAVRPFVEKRVTENMTSTPYNYYFIDCDATGEVYDDFDPGHPSSKEADAGERNRRLQWIAKTFNAVVGSEGGNAYAAQSIAVAEGIFGPFFGWDEPAMKDKNSPYYRGRYYPPNEPDVFFKPVPLLDRFRKLFYDPAHKLPLYATVFHDSVVATHHWNNGHFKYPEVLETVELTELLYLAPPLYHFNLKEFEKRKPEVQSYLKVWSPLHRQFGFEPLTSFRYLSDDHLLQESQFGPDCTITANFSNEQRNSGDVSIPPISAYINAPGICNGPKIFTPEQPRKLK